MPATYGSSAWAVIGGHEATSSLAVRSTRGSERADAASASPSCRTSSVVALAGQQRHERVDGHGIGVDLVDEQGEVAHEGASR